MAREIKDLNGVVSNKHTEEGYCFITNEDITPPFQRDPLDNKRMKQFSRLPSCFAHITAFTSEDWEAIKEGSVVKYRAEVVIRPTTGAVKLHASWVWVEECEADSEPPQSDDDGSALPPWKKQRTA